MAAGAASMPRRSPASPRPILRPEPAAAAACAAKSAPIVGGAVPPLVQSTGYGCPVVHGSNGFQLLGDERIGPPCPDPRPENVHGLVENVSDLCFVDGQYAERSIGLDLHDVQLDCARFGFGQEIPDIGHGDRRRRCHWLLQGAGRHRADRPVPRSTEARSPRTFARQPSLREYSTEANEIESGKCLIAASTNRFRSASLRSLNGSECSRSRRKAARPAALRSSFT